MNDSNEQECSGGSRDFQNDKMSDYEILIDIVMPQYNKTRGHALTS